MFSLGFVSMGTVSFGFFSGLASFFVSSYWWFGSGGFQFFSHVFFGEAPFVVLLRIVSVPVAL